MTRARDRIIAIGAAVILAALAAAVVALVLNAQRSGIDAREDLRLEQIESEASRMDSLIATTLPGEAARNGTPGLWRLTPNDPDDAALLAPTSPDARTGRVLIDRDGTVVNGSLLRDSSVIGTKYEREGIDTVLAGEAAILPVASGLTTSLPTLATAYPVHDASGQLAGAVITETDVSPESPLNAFFAGEPDETSSTSYIDENGVVLLSSDHSLLGKPLDADVIGDLETGFHRADGQVAAVAAVPSAGWHLVFLQDRSEFEGDLTGPLQTALLLFLGAVAIVGVATVVTLQRRLQAAREEQRRLREIGDAREEFTSIVSHELRTPVAGLLGFLQTTIDHWDAMADGERRRAVNRAFTNARSLQTLTADVLDSASIEAQTLTYRFDTMDVVACVDDAVETMRDGSPDRPITIEKPSDPVIVRADAIRIRQVLANLLDNATKSSAPDAPIDVTLERVGNDVTVSVRDRGPGIAPDERERIFEKFTRGRAGVGRGTGLGLYISRHIIEAHGGRIGAHHSQRLLAVAGFEEQGVRRRELERRTDERADVGLVVDDEDLHSIPIGTESTNVAPPPGASS
jgi:signal transduction histidine kinase